MASSKSLRPQKATNGLQTMTRYSSEQLATESAKMPFERASCPTPINLCDSAKRSHRLEHVNQCAPNTNEYRGPYSAMFGTKKRWVDLDDTTLEIQT